LHKFRRERAKEIEHAYLPISTKRAQEINLLGSLFVLADGNARDSA
jgi:hypothetical protein